MRDTTEIVARQYTAYSYPHPVGDLREVIDKGYYEFGAPHLFWPLHWPEGKNLNGLRILNAGCGTNSAAYNALVLPNAHITAIDLSLTSLQHSQYLKEKHQLHNLTLRQMNLLDVAELGQQFDYIISTGVLHHLPDPNAGLRALRDVLAPDGVMNLMVYGRYHRVGVYMLQQAFKLLGCQQQTPDDVELVKATLAALDPTHSVQRYIQSAEDLKHDSGLVDTFLHPQDRAYSVPEVLGFAHDNGLAFWDWTDRLDYSHTACIPAGHPIHARLQTLNPVAQWTVVELLTQTRGTHRFLLCHPERANTASRIRFDTDDWLDWIPIRRYPTAIVQKANPQTGELAKLKRSWHEFTLAPEGTALMEQVDAASTLRQILDRIQPQYPQMTPAVGRAFFAQMHDWGHLMVARVPFNP